MSGNASNASHSRVGPRPRTPPGQIIVGVATPAAPRYLGFNASSADTTPIRHGFGALASDIMGMARHPPTVPRVEEPRPPPHDRRLDWDGGFYNFPPRGTIPRSYWVPDLGILTWKENYTAAQHAQLEGKTHVETGDGLFRPMRGFHARVDIRLGIDHWFELPPDELGQDSEEDGSDEELHPFQAHPSSSPLSAVVEDVEDNGERLHRADMFPATSQDFETLAQQYRSESPESNIYDASPRVSLDSTVYLSPPPISSPLSLSSPPPPPNSVGSTLSLSPRSPETDNLSEASIGSLHFPLPPRHTTSRRFTPIGCISTFPGDTTLCNSPPPHPEGFLALQPLQRTTTPGQTTTMPRPGFLDRPYQSPVPHPEPIPTTFSPDPSTIYPITDENLDANNSLIYHHSGVPRRDGPIIIDTRDNRPVVVRDLELPVLAYGEVVWVVVEHAERGGWFLFNTSPRMEA